MSTTSFDYSVVYEIAGADPEFGKRGAPLLKKVEEQKKKKKKGRNNNS